MVENRILRQNAKNQLGGRLFDMTWLMMVLVFFIYSAAVSVAAGVAFGIGALIITGPMLYGVHRICVKRVLGAPGVELEDMIVGFKESFAQSLVLYLMTSLYTFLWALLFVVPGLVKSYSYAMAPYILQSNPALGWEACIKESRRMMDGHKWQLFCLDFSFVGWYIVGALCLGVGVFWVYPYYELARANFYMALKAQNEPPRTESFDYEPVDPFN